MTLLLKLLIAHLITDFFIQPTSWVKSKKEKLHKSPALYYHVLITALGAAIAVGKIKYWYIVLIIAITHGIIDWIKLRFGKDNLQALLLDQLFHVLVIFGVVHMAGQTIWSTEFVETINSKQFLTIVFAYLLVTMPAGFIVGKATARWQNELAMNENQRDSLKDAGIWIGILERILVLTFVLFSQFQAIGFLIAAKSILRFSDKSENNPRKKTEYVLIGTLISFTIALFVGILIQ